MAGKTSSPVRNHFHVVLCAGGIGASIMQTGGNLQTPEATMDKNELVSNFCLNLASISA
jgi:carbamate kinase